MFNFIDPGIKKKNVKVRRNHRQGWESIDYPKSKTLGRK